MLGYDVVTAVLFARVVDRHDVRMLQHADHMRLVEEHLPRNFGTLRVAIFFNVVDLDRDVAAIIRVMRQKDGASAALADLVDNDVLADLLGHVIRALDLRNLTGHFVSQIKS